MRSCNYHLSDYNPKRYTHAQVFNVLRNNESTDMQTKALEQLGTLE